MQEPQGALSIHSHAQTHITTARPGAADNPQNRYTSTSTSPFDDGWDAIPQRHWDRGRHRRARRAISYNDSPDIPFDRSLNPYRGCEHGCIYCYASDARGWISPRDWISNAACSRAQSCPTCCAKSWRNPLHAAPVAIGGITDGYQPIEREHRIARRILEILNETQHPTLLITKAAMIERDIDLLGAMAEKQLIEVAVSLTTLQPSLARVMEPRAASPRRRLRTIATLSRAAFRSASCRRH